VSSSRAPDNPTPSRYQLPALISLIMYCTECDTHLMDQCQMLLLAVTVCVKLQHC
jgi:hypothetical protein